MLRYFFNFSIHFSPKGNYLLDKYNPNMLDKTE